MSQEEIKQPEGQESASGESLDHDHELVAEPNEDSSEPVIDEGHEVEEPAADTASVAELRKKLEEANQVIAEQKDAVLRAAAEEQNVRRRAQRDVENAHKFALEKFSADLLPVVDTLERALDAQSSDEETAKAMREGVELTLKMLLDALKKHGVEQLDPVGEPFNPQEHEAMSMQPNPDMEPNTVMAVLQKGYSLNGRLVRPAMVVVSKGA
ncbi:MAG: nucleotide exchange factor GrpE [Ketobacteraceae bacterium]|nr:nucleotide exchange factor GrpE [Ketobacteraceae bacterium]